MEAAAWHLLGRALQGMAAHGRALACFQRAAELYGLQQRLNEDPPASLHLAKLLWQQGEREAALAMLKRLIARQGARKELLALLQAWEATPCRR